MPWNNDDPDKRRQDSRRYNAAYRRERLKVMQRARWRCELGLAGCTGTATECDHADQAGDDPNHQNMRAACKSCHAKVTAQQGKGYRANGRSRRRKPPPFTSRTQW